MSRIMIENLYGSPITKLKPERAKMLQLKINNLAEKQHSNLISFNISGNNSIIDKIIQQTARKQKAFDNLIVNEKKKLNNKVFENRYRNKKLSSQIEAKKNGFIKVRRISKVPVREKRKIFSENFEKKSVFYRTINKHRKFSIDKSERFHTHEDSFDRPKIFSTDYSRKSINNTTLETFYFNN